MASNEHERAALTAKRGRVWTEGEMREEFTVHGTMAPFLTVTRRSDGRRGSLEFTGSPRLFFAFVEDES